MTDPVTAETICPRCGLGITAVGSSPGGLTYRCANGHEWLSQAISVATPTDPIDHPAHYTAGQIEAIDAIKSALGSGFAAYLRGNILKYCWRLEHKGGLEDAKKAAWYCQRLVEELGAEKNPPGGG